MTHDAGVVDKVVDALLADNLGRLACRVIDRLGIVHVEPEDVQSRARRRRESLQGIRFRWGATRGEHDVIGRLEELFRDLQADSTACPVSGGK